MARPEHLIVLMLENRSFDHMLGNLIAPDYPIEGLTPDKTNEDTTEEPVPTDNLARYAGDFDPDPGHDFSDVMLQMYGTKTPVPGQEPDMSGFIKSYAEICGGDVLASRRIMHCFDPPRLPVLGTLAHQFCVCDHWFASVPGPTLPNRLFAHCGTSGGRLDMSPDFFSGFTTVYQVLQEANRGATIYSAGWSSAATFNELLKFQEQSFGTLEQFFSDVEDDDLPAYSFLEPRYSTSDDQGTFLPQNDQHPDSDVFEGEKLIRRVYEAIREKESLWRKSMLVITYDEHGGLYDHVTPPKAVAPDDGISENPQFDFTRLGVRVPAIVVSPFIDARRIISDTNFDHTSLIASALDWFGKGRDPRLGKRVADAPTLERCMNRTSPRTDKVQFPPMNPPPPAPRVPAPLNTLQAAHIQEAARLEQKLPPKARTGINPASIRTDIEADRYCRAVFAAAKANLSS